MRKNLVFAIGLIGYDIVADIAARRAEIIR